MTALTPAALAEMEQRAREAAQVGQYQDPGGDAWAQMTRDVAALLAYVRELEAEKEQLSYDLAAAQWLRSEAGQ